MNDSPAQPARRPGFTLVELLVVIGIIALLVSILISVVGRVRLAAQGADTQATIRAIDSAVTSYYGDHQAYPGPLGDAQLAANVAKTGVDVTGNHRYGRLLPRRPDERDGEREPCAGPDRRTGPRDDRHDDGDPV